MVTWRRAQMVLLSAQGMPVAKIAEVSFTSDDRVRDVIRNSNADGFDSLSPKYSRGRPKTFTLPERREIKKLPQTQPPLRTTHPTCPFSASPQPCAATSNASASPHRTPSKPSRRLMTWVA